MPDNKATRADTENAATGIALLRETVRQLTRRDLSLPLLATTLLLNGTATAGDHDGVAESPTSVDGTAASQSDAAGTAPPPDASQPSPDADVLVYGHRKYRPDNQTSATGLEMRLIDTPQSISVITSDMLEEINARSVYDALDMVPGINQSGYSFGNEKIIIRGQRSDDARVNGMVSELWSKLDSFALERVELVRGPATVVYGVTGAFGGEVNQVLKRPRSGFHAQFGVESGDFDRTRYEADLSGSIPGTGERLKVRVTGAYTDYGIFQHTVGDVENLDRMLSAAVTFDATEATAVNFNFYRQQRDYDPVDGCVLQQDGNGLLSIPKYIDAQDYYCANPRQAEGLTRNDIFIANLTHTFANDWRFETSAGYFFWRNHVAPYSYLFGPAGAFGLAEDEALLYTYDQERTENSYTWNMSLGGKFDLGGRTHQLFTALEWQQREYLEPTYASFGLGVFNLHDGGQGVLADGSVIPLVQQGSELWNTQHFKSDDLRGSIQFLLNPIDRLNVLVGYLIERNEQKSRTDNLFNGVSEGSDQVTEDVMRFGVTYDLADGGHLLSDARAYFSYAEGFSPNVGIFDTDGNPLDAPQAMKSYEIGLKTEWLDGEIGANIAAYQSRLTNIPSFSFVPGTGSFDANSLEGKRDFDGVELEIVGRPVPGWNVALSYAYTHTEIHDARLQGATLRVASVPLNQASLFTSYQFLNGALKGFTIGASAVYKEDYPFVDQVASYFDNGFRNQVIDSGHTRFDMRASYAGFSGRLGGLELWANVYNVTDVDFWTSLNGYASFSIMHGAPRTLTAGASYRF